MRGKKTRIEVSENVYEEPEAKAVKSENVDEIETIVFNEKNRLFMPME